MNPVLRGLATGVALATSLTAQAAVVNEVLYDPIGADSGFELIEIANPNGAPINMLGFSLCINTGPLNRVYWSFPNVAIPAGGFLTVHWMTNGVNTATDVFTGTANVNFDCTLPFLLNNTNGSVSIYAIPGSDCLGFANPANIVDFVQWGSGGTIRETVAVNAGIWTTGDFVPAVPEGQSIAYVGAGNTSQDYFADLCPTFGSANTGPGTPSVSNYAAGCNGTGGVPSFKTVGGPPAFGNQSFGLAVDNALGGASSALFLAGAPTSIPIVGCNPGIVVAPPILSVPWVVGPTLPLPLPCTGLPAGASLFLQWIILDPGAIGGVAMSDGCQVTF